MLLYWSFLKRGMGIRFNKMDNMCAIISGLADWISRLSPVPLVYASCSRTRSLNRPAPYLGVIYQAEGAFDWWKIGGQRIKVPERHLGVFWTHEGACSSEPPGPLRLWSCAFDVGSQGPLADVPAIGLLPCVPIIHHEHLVRAYCQVAVQFLMPPRPGQLRLKAAVLEWLAVILDELEHHPPYDGVGSWDPPVLKAMEFLYANLADPGVRLDDCARAAGLSRHHFGRIFRSQLGQSPMDYLASIRMAHACYLLRETHLRVCEIANEVGYEDALHFSRLFRQRKGLSPRAYRETGNPADGPEGDG